MRGIVYYFRLLSLYLFVAVVLDASAQVQPADTSFYAQYPFIRITNTQNDIPQISDDDFFSSAAKVVFPVGKYNLPQDSEFLRQMEQTLIPQLNRDSMQLLRVVMRGAASPEGSYELNRQLGEKRAQALLTFLTDRVQFPVADNVLLMGNDVEDYRSLCLMMRDAADEDYQLVQALCDEHLAKNGPAVLKGMLQQAQGGRLWQRLLNQYFPQLRTARLMLCFRKYVPETLVIEELKPVELPKVVDTVVIEKMPEPVVLIPEETQSMAMTTDTMAVVEKLNRRELISLKTNLLFYAIYMPGYDRWCPIPNVALEYYPKRGHFTYGFSFDMPWWQDYDAHKFFQLRNYQLETRYYFRSSSQKSDVYSLKSEVYSPKSEVHSPQSDVYSLKSEVLNLKSSPAYSGFYLQAYVNAGLYGICFDADRGWVGEGYGAGLGFGYVTPISRNGHWRLEFALQAGFFRTKYDPYKYENPIDPDYHDDLYYYKWTLTPDLFKKRQYRWNWIGPTRIGITLSYDLLYRRIQKKGASFKSTELTLPQQTLPQPLPAREGSIYINSQK